MPINAALGTNYAFLNRHPEGTSLLDWLGPWPVYVGWLAVLVAAVWGLMTWLWVRRGPAGADRTGPGQPAPSPGQPG